MEPIRELRLLLGIQQRWDALRGASKFYADKQYAKGVELLSAASLDSPDDAIILYDLACYESLAGRRGAALAHLRRSLALDPKNREMAKGDRDFESLKDDAEFRTTAAMPGNHRARQALATDASGPWRRLAAGYALLDTPLALITFVGAGGRG